MFEIDSPLATIVPFDYSSIKTIPKIDVSDLTYSSFFTNYMLPNIPCIIKGITDNWQSSLLWITKQKKVDLDYLAKQYGSDIVHVYRCKERFYNTQSSYSNSFQEYLDSFNSSCERTIFKTDQYIKNWHLKLNHPEDQFYEVPIFFASDWLNEYCVNCLDDDYRFVYMGPVGTWTPFHIDVFASYSWSANVCGQKKWILVPPGEEEHMKDSWGNIPYDLQSSHSVCVSTVSDETTDTSTSAEGALYSNNVNNRCIEIIQNPGEAIFIPSKWHHQVHNLSYTISVNHNWINGCNIQNMCEALIKTLADVKDEIRDCSDMEDFEDHCQIMLNSLFGMDYKSFYQFLAYIATKRIEMLNSLCSKVIFHGHEIGFNHILFDLKCLKNVLEHFVKCEEMQVLDWCNNADENPQQLLNTIKHTLQINDCSEYLLVYF